MSRFAIGHTDFERDGAPVRILSGALHYFRVHPDAWAHRIAMAKAMGLNTIETYVPWNAHAPQRGEFRTDGILDLPRFLDEIHAAGMQAIVRPGPYICAEWDGGGLPGWLFQDPEVGVRRSEPKYIEAVDEFLAQVYEIVAPRQIDNDGPVVLVQIENEYGAYGSDKEYLRHLVDVTRAAGITVPLTTIDQPFDLAKGSLPGELHMTASFGSRSKERLAILREHQPTGPLMCAEFWNGWFDWWGSNHHTTSAEESAKDLDELLALGGSFNLYMFHGGTNFGFSNGANDKGLYLPTTTSYDYDAPLDETGRPTAKFWAFREVIAKYAPVPQTVPEPEAMGAPITAPITGSGSVLEYVAQSADATTGHESARVPTTDEIGLFTGFSTYSVSLPERPSATVLQFGEVRDRAQFFLDGTPVGALSRENHDTVLALPAGPVQELTVIVEDQGRVNYASRIGEHKGLIGPALLDGQELTGWTIAPVNLDDPEGIAAGLEQGTSGAGPAFLRAEFTTETPGADLHLSTKGLGKGVAWVNGFNLGRYWSRGPQHSLFVPGQLITAGVNTVLVMELNGTGLRELSFESAADLGHTEL